MKRTLKKKESGEEDEKEKKLGCCIIPCTGTGTASSPPADKLIHQVFVLFLPTRLSPTSFHKDGCRAVFTNYFGSNKSLIMCVVYLLMSEYKYLLN